MLSKYNPKTLSITIVIPVYNAEKFVRRAVESALEQKETDEILLIEDGSTDSSLEECSRLRSEYGVVKLIRHEHGLNKGAGASRNFGIMNAKNEWIGFLDADDFFLPKRFQHIPLILEEYPDCEAICDGVGVHFDDKEGEARWKSLERESLTTLKGDVRPDNMYEAQLGLSKEISGHCATDGITVKKKALLRVKMFPEHLNLHQDTALWAKLGAAAQMYPGILNKPVAMRGVHRGNRITASRSQKEIAKARILTWHYLFSWGRKRLSKCRSDITLNVLLTWVVKLEDDESDPLKRFFKIWSNLIMFGFQEPRVIIKKVYHQKVYLSTRWLLGVLKKELFR